MFNERKTKLTLLSLLSAVAVVSTAFAGISIYAQTDDSNMTTFEEQAQNGTEDTTTAGNTTSSANATSGNTSTADVQGLLDGLVVCDVGTAEVNGQTQAASVDNSTLGTPTVSVKVMTETEVAAAAGNETGTASANDTSIASAGCKMLGEGTSTSGNATGNATGSDMSNATSAGGNTTLTGNTTSSANATSTSSNMTSTAASDTGSNQQILVIDGQDFAPGQVVLIFSNDQLVGIDDVDGSGNIEAKIPEPHAGSSNGTSTASAGTDLRFVESGTLRSGTFAFDGQTLTSAGQGDIQAEGSGNQTSTSSTGNATSTATGNSTSSTTNSTGNYTPMQ